MRYTVPDRPQVIDSKRRDVGVVDRARLESVCRGNSTEGSNPSLSANSQAIKYKRLILFTSLYREWALWRSVLLLMFWNEIRRLLSTALHRVTLDVADKRRGTAHDGSQDCDGQRRRQGTFAVGDRVNAPLLFIAGIPNREMGTISGRTREVRA